MQKTKVVKSIEANQGIVKKFTKKLYLLNSSLLKWVQNRLLLHLNDSNQLALDKSLSNPETLKERRKLKELRKKVLSSLRKKDPQSVKKDLQSFIDKNIDKWLDSYSKESEQLVNWLVRNIVYTTTKTQQKNLIASGINKHLFDNWKVPTIKNQFTSTTAHIYANEFCEEMKKNVKRETTKEIYKESEWLSDWLMTEGELFNIPDHYPLEVKNIERFAQSHGNAINQMVQRANCQDIGITEGIWIHVAGQYTSRETHKKMNGKRFDLNIGLYDEDVKRNVLTGELPYCRCVFRYVLPKEFQEEQ